MKDAIKEQANGVRTGLGDHTAEPRPPRRGRPPGSVTLTDDKANQIVLLVRGGASIRSAAEIAGIPVRTLQEWIARGGGRSRKPAPTRLKALARDVSKAQAEARASAEVRVHENQPATWLRSLSGDPSGPDSASDDDAPDPERIRRLGRLVRDALLQADPSETVPPCPNPRCRCVYHRERTAEEQAAVRALASRGAAP